MGEIFAQDYFLFGTVHTEDGKPVHNAEVRIVGDGFEVTTVTGEFRIKSPVNGTDVGSVNIPGKPISNHVKIIIVPRGSYSLLTDARINEIIKDAEYRRENKMPSNYAKLSDDYGLAEEVLRDSVENRLSGKEEKQQIVDKSTIYYRLGNEKFLDLDFDSAKSCYKFAIRINPSHIDAITMLGRVYQIRQEYQNALICYHKALSLSIKIQGKSNLKVLECLGLVYKEMHKYKKAISYFHEALKIIVEDYSNDLPRKTKILKNLADSYLLLGEYSEYFKYLDEAKKTQSDLNGKDN